MDDRFDEIESKVNSKVKRIAKHTVKNTSDIKAVKTRVSELESDIPKVNERLDNLEANLPKNFDDRIKKVMAEQRSNAFIWCLKWCSDVSTTMNIFNSLPNFKS